MVLFNYSTIGDVIPSHFFFFIKSHVAFTLDASTSALSSATMYYIALFTTAAVAYLINLKYASLYDYTAAALRIDVILVTVVVLLVLFL